MTKRLLDNPVEGVSVVNSKTPPKKQKAISNENNGLIPGSSVYVDSAPLVGAADYNEIDKIAAKLFFEEGKTYYELGQYQKSIVLLKKEKDLDPQNDDFLNAYDKAKEDDKFNEGEADFHDKLGKIHLKQEGMPPLEKAKDLGPQPDLAVNELRDHYTQLINTKDKVTKSYTVSKDKLIDRMITYIKLACITDGDEKHKFIDEALAICLTTKYSSLTYINGMKAFEKEISECNFIEPEKKAKIYCNIADEYLSRDQKHHIKKALELFEASITINSNFLYAYDQAVKACLKLSGFAEKDRAKYNEKALIILQNQHKLLEPNSAYGVINKNLQESILSNLSNGSPDEIIARLEKIKDLDPKNDFVVNDLRYCYKQLINAKVKVSKSHPVNKDKLIEKMIACIKLACITEGDEKHELIDKAINICLSTKQEGLAYINGMQIFENEILKCNFIKPDKKAKIYCKIANAYLSRDRKYHIEKALEFFEAAIKINGDLSYAYDQARIECLKLSRLNNITEEDREKYNKKAMSFDVILQKNTNLWNVIQIIALILTLLTKTCKKMH